MNGPHLCWLAAFSYATCAHLHAHGHAVAGHAGSAAQRGFHTHTARTSYMHAYAQSPAGCMLPQKQLVGVPALE